MNRSSVRRAVQAVSTQLRTLAGWVINMSEVIVYLHVASHDYQKAIQHTPTSTLSLTHRIFQLFLAQLPPLFKHKFKWKMKVPYIIESKNELAHAHKTHKHTHTRTHARTQARTHALTHTRTHTLKSEVCHKQTKEGVIKHKGPKSQYS